MVLYVVWLEVGFSIWASKVASLLSDCSFAMRSWWTSIEERFKVFDDIANVDGRLAVVLVPDPRTGIVLSMFNVSVFNVPGVPAAVVIAGADVVVGGAVVDGDVVVGAAVLTGAASELGVVMLQVSQ